MSKKTDTTDAISDDPAIDLPVMNTRPTTDKIPLKTFLLDRQLFKRHGRQAVDAFAAENRSEPSRSDWNNRLLEFMLKAR